jgi:chemotaxis protein CheD
MSSSPITVGIGEFSVKVAEGVLITYSLGSCVAVALYDPGAKVAGLAHILLAVNSRTDRNEADIHLPNKYANVAIPSMIKSMIENGADKSRIIAKIAGGACLFESAQQDPIFGIGKQNVEAVRNILAKEDINIVAEDCGKNYGRTLEFNVSTSKLSVRTLKKGLTLQI